MSRDRKPWLALTLKAEHGYEPNALKLACRYTVGQVADLIELGML
jgi:hypothetical protein